MFDETFFTTSLPAHLNARGAESTDQPVAHMTLRGGQAYTLGRILEVSPQWVMCEVYPPDSKTVRQPNPPALDRLAVAYEHIVQVLVTLEPKPRDFGFRA